MKLSFDPPSTRFDKRLLNTSTEIVVTNHSSTGSYKGRSPSPTNRLRLLGSNDSQSASISISHNTDNISHAGAGNMSLASYGGTIISNEDLVAAKYKFPSKHTTSISKQQQQQQQQTSKMETERISVSKGGINMASKKGAVSPFPSHNNTTTSTTTATGGGGGDHYHHTGSRRLHAARVPKNPPSSSYSSSNIAVASTVSSSDSLSATASLSAADFLNHFDLSQSAVSVVGRGGGGGGGGGGGLSFLSNKVPTITMSATPSSTIMSAQTRLRTVDMSAQVGQGIDAETSFISGVTSSKLRLREGSSLMFPTVTPPNIVLLDNTSTDHDSEMSNYSFNDSIHSAQEAAIASSRLVVAPNSNPPVLVDMNFLRKQHHQHHHHHHSRNNDMNGEVSSWPSSHSAGSFELEGSFHMDTVIAPRTLVAQQVTTTDHSNSNSLFIDAMDYIHHQQTLAAAQSGSYNNDAMHQTMMGDPIEVVSSRYNSPK